MSTLNRRQSYQHGSLLREKRKRGPDVWVYRYFEITTAGERKRSKVIVGTIQQFPTRAFGRTRVPASSAERQSGTRNRTACNHD
jgi:hypothetical protein